MKSGKMKIIGIDPGADNIGVSEYEFSYQQLNTGYSGKSYLDEYYVWHPKKKADERLIEIYNFFIRTFKYPTGHYDEMHVFIENVPAVSGNANTAAILHQITAAIKIPMLLNQFTITQIYPGQWKKEVIGDGAGNWKKDKIMHWARGNQFPIDDEELTEDMVDALCIGMCGLKRLSAKMKLKIDNFATREQIMQSSIAT